MCCGPINQMQESADGSRSSAASWRPLRGRWQVGRLAGDMGQLSFISSRVDCGGGGLERNKMENGGARWPTICFCGLPPIGQKQRRPMDGGTVSPPVGRLRGRSTDKTPHRTKEADRLPGQPRRNAKGVAWSWFHRAFHPEGMEGRFGCSLRA